MNVVKKKKIKVIVVKKGDKVTIEKGIYFDILCMMRKYNIEPKRIQFVYPKKGTLSNILLIEGIKNGKPGLKLEYPLIVHRENGEYTEELKKYVRGGNL